ncbi:MAG: hypothetical protein K0R50_3098 [Eubacterium sp.]|nr:hypothetical protein [Eubacterium sp.]
MDNVQGITNHYETVKRVLFLFMGWLSAILSLFFYPFVLGMVGVISGILATKNNKSRLGVYLVVASIVLMGLGLAFSTRLLSLARDVLNI